MILSLLLQPIAYTSGCHQPPIFYIWGHFLTLSFWPLYMTVDTINTFIFLETSSLLSSKGMHWSPSCLLFLPLIQPLSSHLCSTHTIYLVTLSKWLVSTHTSFIDNSSVSLIWAPDPYIRMKAACSSPFGYLWLTLSQFIQYSLSSLSQTYSFPTPSMGDRHSPSVTYPRQKSGSQPQLLSLTYPIRISFPSPPSPFPLLLPLELQWLPYWAWPSVSLLSINPACSYRVIALEDKFEHLTSVLNISTGLPITQILWREFNSSSSSGSCPHLHSLSSYLSLLSAPLTTPPHTPVLTFRPLKLLAEVICFSFFYL